MRYRVYSCCTDTSSRLFGNAANGEGVFDSLTDALDQIHKLAQKGKDAWYEPEDDDD